MKKLVASSVMAALLVSAGSVMASGIENYGVVGVECKQVGCTDLMLGAKKNNIDAFVSNKNLQVMFMHGDKKDMHEFVEKHKLTTVNDTHTMIKQMQKQ
jgi:hypothetical protein